MKSKFFTILTAIALCFSPHINFAKSAPDFTTATSFVFPSVGILFSQCQCKSTPAFTVDSISAASALLCWVPVPCPSSYIVSWRRQGTTNWIDRIVLAPAHCTSFTNNYPAVYEIRVATICTNGDTSAFSEIFTFQTYPSCLPPTNLSTDNVQATGATAHWSPAPDATKQNFKYRKAGNATWTTVNIPGTATSYTMMNLLPLTSYEWEVRSTCSDSDRTVRGAFAAVQTFTTEGMRLAMENITASSVTIYPNPTSDGSFMIALPSSIDHATIEITNLLGQVIYQKEAMVDDGVISVPVKFSEGFPTGTYFVRIIAAQIVYTTELVYHP